MNQVVLGRHIAAMPIVLYVKSRSRREYTLNTNVLKLQFTLALLQLGSLHSFTILGYF